MADLLPESHYIEHVSLIKKSVSNNLNNKLDLIVKYY